MIWTTRDKRRIPISQMDQRHLVNTVKYMRRRVNELLRLEFAVWSARTSCRGEMAQLAAEQSVADQILQATFVLETLMKELKTRSTKPPSLKSNKSS